METETFVSFKTIPELNENINSPFEGKTVSINDSQMSGTKLLNQTCTVLNKTCNKNSTFISPIHTIFPVVNIVVYTLNQSTDREKCFNHINYKDKKWRLWRKKHLSIHFFPHKLCLFYVSTEKVRA